ncbi:hypothetical protein BCV69DRAFT_299387 [Microstroma glucosiphilum]|uniref:Uncharacterized protein n=1 Tax=Pseudomicrostroma glucosiphilum TaxID=1684307 RepID=A0A316U4T8_9BASI|nr:hypothetical protein BCV69DRAFT_299387 [Pseudomicrostroma glucosiphilum]PWN20246.1 hypothetical protein BCV69DRAFT_299387 [Pseudomicrostroma glucosiphilum]
MLPKVPLLTLLQPALQVTTLVLLFIALLCPNPFTDSGIDLMVVRPYNVSSTSTASAATTTLVLSTANTSTSTALPTSSTTASTPSSATTAHTATSTNTSSSVSSSSASPTANASTSSTTSAAQIGLTPASASSSTISAARREYTLPPLANLEALSNSSTSTTTATVYSNQGYSNLELKYGPLGGCFRDAAGVRTCTPASLSPSLASLNARLSVVGQLSTAISITGLPSAFKITPILLFVTFGVFLLIYLLSVPQLLPRLFPKSTKFASYLSPESRVHRHLETLVGLAVYARMGCVGLLLGAGISLRLKVSKAVYAFNAANVSHTMPASLTLVDSDDVGMQAVAGSSFSLIWATVVLIGAEIYLERRRIRLEAAIAQARKDIESQYGRGVFEMLEEARSRGDLSAKAESIYQGHAASIKPARSIYGGSEYAYGADTKGRPTKSVMRTASFRSTGSTYHHGPQRYTSSDKDFGYNVTAPPSRRVQLHPASSHQAWLEERDDGGYYEQPAPFTGPGWSEAHPPMSQTRSLSRSQSRSRIRPRAESPTPSYWTSNGGKEALEASTLHTLAPSRMDRRGSYSGSDVDPEMEHLPPRGPSALSDYSLEPSRSIAGASGRRQLQTGHAGVAHAPFGNLRRKPSHGSRVVRGPSRGVPEGEEDEEEERQQHQQHQQQEEDEEEYLDSHYTAGSTSEERRRLEREREELAALEREILQRRRRELEWQMGRDQDRAAAATTAAAVATAASGAGLGSSRSSSSTDDTKIVGLGRLGYRKAADAGRV